MVGHHGGGPVDQRPPLAVDEQVERVEIAVADDLRVVCGGGEVFGGSRQVVPPDDGRLGETFQEVDDVGLAGVAGEFVVKTVDRAPVKAQRRRRRAGQAVVAAGSEPA